jgi:chromosomal replication initiation ATPase DnaA
MTPTKITVPNRLTLQLIGEIVAHEFRFNLSDLRICSTRAGAKQTDLCRARQHAMYFSKEYTKQTLASIGTFFNRNHATVLHAIRIINNEILLYRDSKLTFDVIKSKLDSYNYELQVKLDMREFDYPSVEISAEALSYQIN